MSCPFCKIAAKEFNAKIISETNSSLVFLDINPVSPGHSLIIPKSHSNDLLDTPDGILSELITHAKRVGDLLVDALGATGFNILNASGKSAQQSVFHLHLHIVPRFDNDNLDLWFHGNSNNPIDIEKIFTAIQTQSPKVFSL